MYRHTSKHSSPPEKISSSAVTLDPRGLFPISSSSRKIKSKASFFEEALRAVREGTPRQSRKERFF